MGTLEKRIDFALIIPAVRCNPNGDPVVANWPRQDFKGYGLISDVCLKRKIRDRLHDFGESVLCLSPEQTNFEFGSVRAMIENEKELAKLQKERKELEFRKMACEKWIDVRSFGMVFAFKGGEGGGSSIGIRGPVSIRSAVSLEPVEVEKMQITKSFNSEDAKYIGAKASDTIGFKYIIEKGVYVTYGSIYPQAAEVTGFTNEDAENIKLSLSRLYENDASAARPAGSIEVAKLLWWTHKTKMGVCSPAKVHNSLHVTQLPDKPYFEYTVDTIDGVDLEVI